MFIDVLVQYLCHLFASPFYDFFLWKEGGVIMFNATFNNISVISWRSVLLAEEGEHSEKTPDLPQVILELVFFSNLIAFRLRFYLYFCIVGDKLILASTDYDWRQAEEVEVITCDTCTQYQVRLSGMDIIHWYKFVFSTDM